MHKWQQRNQEGKLNELKEFSLPEIVKELLRVRGFDNQDEVKTHFQSSLKNLRDPFALKGMDTAVERLLQARVEHENVLIYGDFDLDGSTGVSLLMDAFTKLGFENVSFYQPSRLNEGYGLHAEAIERLFNERAISVVVTVDLGITAVNAVDKANELGVDVIITDHHLPQETLPKALAIVNPNANTCVSGLGHLSGVGVGFYLVLALRKFFRSEGVEFSEFDPKDLLDLYTIGTLTDMVPVVEENRSLIKHGLRKLGNTHRLGLRYLLKELNFENRDLSSQDVAIGISPKINALSRMEKDILPVDLFLVKEVEAARKLVKEVIATNKLRKKLQARAEKEVFQRLKGEFSFVFEFDQNFHKGVIGLVATKVVQNFSVPAFIGAMDDSGKIVGSARMPDGIDLSLPEILDFCSESLISFGGHKCAAGFSLSAEKAEEFSKRLQEYFSHHKLKPEGTTVFYDTIAKISDFQPNTMKWIEELGPFGTDFPVPVFNIENALIVAVKELKGGHLRWTLQQGSAQSLPALYFSPPPKALDINNGQYVNLLVEAQWNYFLGTRSIQLLIKDFKTI